MRLSLIGKTIFITQEYVFLALISSSKTPKKFSLTRVQKFSTILSPCTCIGLRVNQVSEDICAFVSLLKILYFLFIYVCVCLFYNLCHCTHMKVIVQLFRIGSIQGLNSGSQGWQQPLLNERSQKSSIWLSCCCLFYQKSPQKL